MEDPEQYAATLGLLQGGLHHAHNHHAHVVPPEVVRVLEAAGQHPAASQHVLQQYIDSLQHLQAAQHLSAAQAANAVLGDLATATSAPQPMQLRSLVSLPLTQASLPQVATASHLLQAKPQEDGSPVSTMKQTLLHGIEANTGGLVHVSEAFKLPNGITGAAPTAEMPLAALGKALLVPLGEKESLKAPVVTLQGSRQLSIYFIIEQIFRAEYLSGAERFWKVIRNSFKPALETWRPRVNGQQLKALNKVRLPESEEEWHRVLAVLHALSGYLRPDTDPQKALKLFRDLRSLVEDVWLGRKKDSREGTMTRKRSVADLGNGNMADANKRAMVADQLRSQTASPSATPEMQSKIFAPLQLLPNTATAAGMGQLPSAATHDLQLILQSRDSGLPSSDHTSPAGSGMLDQQDSHAILNGLQRSLLPPSSSGEQGLHQPASAPATLASTMKAGSSGSLSALHQRATSLPPVPPFIAPVPTLGQQLPTVIPTSGAESQEDLRLVKLVVGGTQFMTTSATLCSVKGSFFWEHSGTQWPAGSSGGSTQAASEGLFVDRDGTNFKYILKFLRLVKEHSKGTGTQKQMLDAAIDSMVLPNCVETLEDLRSDAKFYKLPGLESRIVKKLNEEKDDRWETLYFETGYQPHAEKQMQLPEVAIRQLAEKQERGFKIVQIQPGVHYASHSDMSRPDPSALQNVVVNAHWLVTLQKQALLPSK